MEATAQGENMKINDILNERILVLDGAMGTVLQKNGLKIGEKPESLNLTNPSLIQKIHYEYLVSGADVVYANTFGANAIKMPNLDYKSMILEGVKIAGKAVEQAGKGYVALDIGSLGELLEPMGSLTFDKAYETFSEVVNIAKDYVDLVVLETMSDLYELKAGILAVKENCDLPLFTTMSFDKNGRTFSGCPIESMILVAEGLGVDALGLNCSLSPTQLKPLVERLVKTSSLPIILKPNAGIPVVRNGYTEFDLAKEEFASLMASYVDMGVSIVGGCCGTDKEYIKLLKEKVDGKKTTVVKKDICAVCSGLKYQPINKPLIVGERINPTGKKAMKEAILAGDFGYIEGQAIEQAEAGAHILDVNMGVVNVDEALMMKNAVQKVQGIVDLPLQIDSSNASAIEKGLRYVNGKAIVNSVNGEDKSLNTILPLAKKYGAMIVGLTVDENGVPKTFEDRIRIAEKIIKRANEYEIKNSDIIIDCLTLTVGAEQEQAMITLKAIEYVKKTYGVKTILGVSNVSFGLPERSIVNRTFLTMALQSGLDLAIVNPNLAPIMESYRAYNLLSGEDKDGVEYVNAYSGVVKEEKSSEVTNSLQDAIITSNEKDATTIVKRLLLEENGLDIIENRVIPALNVVGERYEKGTLFLPQLISSSEVAKKVCDYVKANMEKTSQSKYKIVLATVEGDVHDIGKNIVKTVLQNYGYEIIDLGKDVKVEKVVEAVLKHKPKVLGLSALMTTTVVNMERTIEAVKKVDDNVIICVGGAVLSSSIAKEIGADYYTKDPRELTVLLEKF